MRGGNLAEDGLYRLCQLAIGAAARLYCGLAVEGRQHVPSSGGCLLVANHASLLDPMIVGSAIRRRIHYLARSTLFTHPVGAALIAMVGAHPIERGGSDRRGLAVAADLLAAGLPVLMFPEGTRGRGEGLLPFRRGFVLVARLARVPVLPVGLTGTDRVLPRGASVPRPRPMTVRIGAPVPWDEAGRIGAGGIRDRVIALLGPPRGMRVRSDKSAHTAVSNAPRDR